MRYEGTAFKNEYSNFYVIYFNNQPKTACSIIDDFYTHLNSVLFFPHKFLPLIFLTKTYVCILALIFLATNIPNQSNYFIYVAALL